VGLDVARWERDFPSPEVRAAVERDLEEARRRGIHAVPTLVFNDRWQVQGAVPEAMLHRVIDDILAGRDPTQR
jgi:predicted DsbA family dithiol-disulfide isomerase